MNFSRIFTWVFSIYLVFAGGFVWSYGNSIPKPEAEPIAHTAKVVETMSSAGYTYVRVEEKARTFWIALPEARVEVGETISFYEQMLMENFTSRSLNRTFDRILFVEAINKGTELPTRAEAVPSHNKEQPKQNFEYRAPQELGEAIGRFSIKDVFAKKAELNGKVIEVKGSIAKLTRQIMGRDWIHLEDGSGTKEEKNHKIVFRTIQGGVNVGDEVVAKGVLYMNKDFGHGYFYPVIVEDAVFNQ